jgi:hypothetical protein
LSISQIASKSKTGISEETRKKNEEKGTGYFSHSFPVGGGVIGVKGQ